MSGLVISTARLLLSTPGADQAGAMLDFVTRNREYLKPWNPPEPAGLYSLAHWQDVV